VFIFPAQSDSRCPNNIKKYPYNTMQASRHGLWVKWPSSPSPASFEEENLNIFPSTVYPDRSPVSVDLWGEI